MLRFIVLLSILVLSLAELDGKFITHVIHKKNFSRTQYILPCNVCINALLHHIKSPSHNVNEFIQKTHLVCNHATTFPFQQKACVYLLTRMADSFLKDQQNRVTAHQSCTNAYHSYCLDYNAHFIVHCNQRKKKGFCQVIPI